MKTRRLLPVDVRAAWDRWVDPGRVATERFDSFTWAVALLMIIMIGICLTIVVTLG